MLDGIRRGLTNLQIAAELDVSGETVKSHVSNMLLKLDLESRRELAAWSEGVTSAEKRGFFALAAGILGPARRVLGALSPTGSAAAMASGAALFAVVVGIGGLLLLAREHTVDGEAGRGVTASLALATSPSSPPADPSSSATPAPSPSLAPPATSGIVTLDSGQGWSYVVDRIDRDGETLIVTYHMEGTLDGLDIFEFNDLSIADPDEAAYANGEGIGGRSGGGGRLERVPVSVHLPLRPGGTDFEIVFPRVAQFVDQAIAIELTRDEDGSWAGEVLVEGETITVNGADTEDHGEPFFSVRLAGPAGGTVLLPGLGRSSPADPTLSDDLGRVYRLYHGSASLGGEDGKQPLEAGLDYEGHAQPGAAVLTLSVPGYSRIIPGPRLRVTRDDLDRFVAQSAARPATLTPELAIAGHLAALPQPAGYAGDCSQPLPDSPDRLCTETAQAQGCDNAPTHAFALRMGPIGGRPDTWLFLVRQGSEWRVAGTALIGAESEPPWPDGSPPGC